MASLIVRNIDDALKARLRIQAAYHGRSMEEEVRQILRAALATDVIDLPLPEPVSAPVRTPRAARPSAALPRPDAAVAMRDDRPDDTVFAEAPPPARPQPHAIFDSAHLALPARPQTAEAVSEGLRRRLTSLLSAYDDMVSREQSGRG